MLASLTHLMALWSSPATQSRVARDAGVEIDPVDISPVYMLGLRGPCRASEVAASLHVTRPTMSKQLTRLEAAGLIERRDDPDDRRATIIALSPAGVDAHTRLVERGRAMMHSALRDWPPAEATQFAAQFTRFVDALGATSTQTTATPSAGGSERPGPGSRNGGES